jgi:Na+-transporting NADH:ubiquinone oxidoreductase subunit F
MVFLKKLHKWVGLLIGIQVLLWLLSGLIISLIDPAKVSGKQWVQARSDEPQNLQHAAFIEPDQLPEKLLNGALSIRLTMKNGQPVYRLEKTSGETLVNAIDGTVFVSVKSDAEKIARTDYNGKGQIISVERGSAPDLETRKHHGDYWKVSFSDETNTAIYISVASGEILERRNSYWRVRDFFWMLHIMDYANRENFNHSLIISVALIAIWLGLSGIILLFGSFNRHDFHFLNILGKRDIAVITLTDPAAKAPRKVKLRKGSNLFLSLATHGINLPSDCGGGGECGLCRVRIETSDLPGVNPIESGLVPKPLQKQGYRLACQQEVNDDATLHLANGTLESG